MPQPAPLKVALVDPSLFTLPYDRELVGGLQEAGHEVALYGKALPTREDEAATQFLRPHFYRALEAKLWDKVPKPLYRMAKGLGHVADMRRFCAEMERLRPDVIHFQWLPLPVVDTWFLDRLRRVAPIVLTVHDTLPFNGSPGSSLQSLGAFAALRRFDALIAHTENGRRLVAAHVGDGDRVRCIPHGLLHEGELGADPVAAPAARPPGSPITFLLFGKIKPYKGLDVLIRALAQLEPSLRARCRVKVVGKPYMEVAPLEQLARHLGVDRWITFDWRFVSSSELDETFRAADVLVFPYRQIEASGVLMTAIAVGKPVIATRMGAAAELFDDGKGGFLVPVDEPAPLARAMEAFVASPEHLAACASHVLRLRDSIPSWASIGRLTTAVYERARMDWRAGPLRRTSSGMPYSRAVNRRAPERN